MFTCVGCVGCVEIHFKFNYYYWFFRGKTNIYIKDKVLTYYYKMKTSRKVIGISSRSVGVVIDKSLKEALGIKKGDMVEIDIKKICDIVKKS